MHTILGLSTPIVCEVRCMLKEFVRLFELTGKWDGLMSPIQLLSGIICAVWQVKHGLVLSSPPPPKLQLLSVYYLCCQESDSEPGAIVNANNCTLFSFSSVTANSLFSLC